MGPGASGSATAAKRLLAELANLVDVEHANNNSRDCELKADKYVEVGLKHCSQNGGATLCRDPYLQPFGDNPHVQTRDTI